MHVKVVYDLLFNIWAKVATISGTFRTVKIVNNDLSPRMQDVWTRIRQAYLYYTGLRSQD